MKNHNIESATIENTKASEKTAKPNEKKHPW
jgi:hypothetical protein